MSDLRIRVDGHELTGSWSDGNQVTQDALAEALPLEDEATRWGDELYLRTDVDVPPEETQTAPPVGAVATGQTGTHSVSSGEKHRQVRAMNRVPRPQSQWWLRLPTQSHYSR